MNRSLRNIFLIFILWLIIFIGHFGIVQYGKSSIFVALLDPVIHGLVALVVILPFYLNRKISLSLFLWIVFVATFIDIDHVIMAKSLNPYDVISLPMRPISHSILFSLIIGFSSALFNSRIVKSFKNFWFVFYLFTIALISHVLRDVTDGSDLTPWLFPFESYPFSNLLFFVIFISLSFFHYFVTKKEKKDFRKNSII